MNLAHKRLYFSNYAHHNINMILNNIQCVSIVIREYVREKIHRKKKNNPKNCRTNCYRIYIYHRIPQNGIQLFVDHTVFLSLSLFRYYVIPFVHVLYICLHLPFSVYDRKHNERINDWIHGKCKYWFLINETHLILSK